VNSGAPEGQAVPAYKLRETMSCRFAFFFFSETWVVSCTCNISVATVDKIIKQLSPFPEVDIQICQPLIDCFSRGQALWVDKSACLPHMRAIIVKCFINASLRKTPRTRVAQ